MRVLSAAFLVVFFFLFAIFAIGSWSCNQPPKPNSEAGETVEAAPKDCSAAYGTFFVGLRDSGKFVRTYDKEIVAISTVVIAAFTMILGVFTVSLARSTRVAANAAKRGADYIPNVERGYIVGGGPRIADDGRHYIDIVNYGKTAAILTKVEWGFCDEAAFPKDARVSELLKTGQLTPDEIRTTENVYPPNLPMPPRNTELDLSKAMGKILYGKFTYLILFDSEEHFSTFKLRFIRRPDGGWHTEGLPGSYSDWK
jgi:hypothetical protein